MTKLFLSFFTLLVSFVVSAQNFEYRYTGYHPDSNRYASISSSIVNSKTGDLYFLGLDSAYYNSGEGYDVNYGKSILGKLNPFGQLISVQLASDKKFNGVFPGKIYDFGDYFAYNYYGYYQIYRPLVVVFVNNSLMPFRVHEKWIMAARFELKAQTTQSNIWKNAYYLFDGDDFCHLVNYNDQGYQISEVEILLANKNFSLQFGDLNTYLLYNDTLGLSLKIVDNANNVLSTTTLSTTTGTGSLMPNEQGTELVYFETQLPTDSFPLYRKFVNDLGEIVSDTLIATYPNNSELSWVFKKEANTVVGVKKPGINNPDSLYEHIIISPDNQILEKVYLGIPGENMQLTYSDSIITLCSTQYDSITSLTLLRFARYASDGELVEKSEKLYSGLLSVNELRYQKDGSLTLSGIYNNDGWLMWMKKDKFNVGLSEFSTKAVVCYPNPAKDFVCFEGISPQEFYQLYNSQGQLVKFGCLYNGRLSAETLGSGLYFVHFPQLITTCKLQIDK